MIDTRTSEQRANDEPPPGKINGPVLIMAAALGIVLALVIGHAVTRAWSEVNYIRMEGK